MSSKGRSESTVRTLRVGETLRHALAEVLSRIEINDEALAGVSVTVSGVDVAPDMRNARVYFLPLSGKDQLEVAKALNRHSGFIRGEVAKRVALKFMPRLAFRIDESFETASRIENILHDPRVMRDLGPARTLADSGFLDQDDDGPENDGEK